MGHDYFAVTAKGKDLAYMSYASGARLLNGMKCSRGEYSICFYPEPRQLRERISLLEGPPPSPN